MEDIILIIIGIVIFILGLLPFGCLMWDIIRSVIDDIKYGRSDSISGTDVDDFEYYGPDPTDDFDD